MPAPIIGDVVRITTWCQLGNQASLNVSHWKLTAVGTAGSFVDVANAFAVTMGTIVAPIMNGLSTFNGVLISRLAPSPTSQEQSTTMPVPGGGSDEQEGSQVSAVIKLTTGSPGRKARGRKYIGLLDSANVTGGLQLTAGGIALATAIAQMYSQPTTFTNGGITVVATPVLLNKASPLASVPITNFAVRTLLGTQRRRAGNSRPNISPF